MNAINLLGERLFQVKVLLKMEAMHWDDPLEGTVGLICARV